MVLRGYSLWYVMVLRGYTLWYVMVPLAYTLWYVMIPWVILYGMLWSQCGLILC